MLLFHLSPVDPAPQEKKGTCEGYCSYRCRRARRDIPLDGLVPARVPTLPSHRLTRTCVRAILQLASHGLDADERRFKRRLEQQVSISCRYVGDSLQPIVRVGTLASRALM
jgi:hypothetical protein